MEVKVKRYPTATRLINKPQNRLTILEYLKTTKCTRKFEPVGTVPFIWVF